jgi:hypothetical protein
MVVVRTDCNVLVLENRITALEDADNVLGVYGIALESDPDVRALRRLQIE